MKRKFLHFANIEVFGPVEECDPPMLAQVQSKEPEEGNIVCPGFTTEQFCDCGGDCDAQPTWCGCAAAVTCCQNRGPQEEGPANETNGNAEEGPDPNM